MAKEKTQDLWRVDLELAPSEFEQILTQIADGDLKQRLQMAFNLASDEMSYSHARKDERSILTRWIEFDGERVTSAPIARGRELTLIK